uniref:cytochrome c oxidase subunit III n=1 Tax=Oxyloma wujiaquensis TaxID=2487312 RepID=UPI001D1238E9|nr:cytochrome c oxidase subunit III [Oxyloma wujiaquensis]QZO77379.1 cytochrome c oxidase subunit III [Oxyloma wujiaquensis]
MIVRTPFHLVEFSPWPLLTSFSILSIPISTILFIRMNNIYMLIFTIISTAVLSYLWWRDIVRESTYQGNHTSYVTFGLKLGMSLFILSEICFFFGFFWAYFHSSLSPSIEIGSSWPPIGIFTLETFQVPLLNTCVLLLSGVSITWAHHSIEAQKNMDTFKGLIITVALGVYFLYLQYGEYAETAFSISDSIYGSSFFMATGFHGLHVMVGVTFLFICTIRNMMYHFSKNHHMGFLAAAWYWHFVDVVWLFLYISIYWWGS